MRRWYQYSVLRPEDPPPPATMDGTFEQHAAGMGGYEADAAYQSLDAFFRRYFVEFHDGHLATFEPFLLAHLPPPPSNLLAIGCGRAALELRLMAAGYRVLCTDLAPPPCLAATQRLFPAFRFASHDFLAQPLPGSFAAALAISVIYLFDPPQLRRFFAHAAASLAPGGCLFVTGAGAVDNVWSRLWLDGWLPLESRLIAAAATLRHGRRRTVHQRHFGYRYREAELRAFAHDAGFELQARARFGCTTDWARSVLWRRWGCRLPGVAALCRQLSLLAPYRRIYCLRKTGVRP